jgi:NADH-quinone oxidoreductase subunit I
MFPWLRKGIRTGVVTTRYPASTETMPEAFRGRPALDIARCQAEQGCTECIQVCLPSALSLTTITENGTDKTEGTTAQATQQFMLDYGRCIMCGLCVDACPADALHMAKDYELATTKAEDGRVIVQFTLAGNHEDDEGKEQNHG